jgi:RNA exonuclease 1
MLAHKNETSLNPTILTDYNFRKFYQPKFYVYECCGRKRDSRGCVPCPHVWKQGPQDLPAGVPSWSADLSEEKDGAATQPCKLIAIDCEMSYTLGGMEVTRFVALDVRGALLMDSLVKPHEPVIDLNSCFSGVHNLNGARDMSSIWRELIEEHGVHADTIIVGHGLENDLSMLGLVHARCIDSALLYPSDRGGSYKPGLKSLAPKVLGKAHHCHNTKQKAACALQLVLKKQHSRR